MQVDGQLWRRKLGAPMGGFLSAFYAMLCFAYIEHRCVTPMFRSLGLTGFIKRYMDDVIVVALTESTSDRTKINTFLQHLGSAEVYPPPIMLLHSILGLVLEGCACVVWALRVCSRRVQLAIE